MTPTFMLLIHAGATLAMAGIIWFVQIVHYPLFALVDSPHFARHQHEHQHRTGRVVGPLMILEGVTAGVLFALRPPGVVDAVLWTGAFLLVTIWLSTAFLQVPAHRRLERGFDPQALARLVGTNWIRTIAWTGRAILVLIMLWQTASATTGRAAALAAPDHLGIRAQIDFAVA